MGPGQGRGSPKGRKRLRGQYEGWGTQGVQQSARETSLPTSGPWQEEKASAGPSLGPVRALVSLGGASCGEKDQVLLFATMFIGKPRSGLEPPTGAPSVAALYLVLSICHLRTACQAQAGTQRFRGCTIIQARAQKAALPQDSWPTSPDSAPKGKQPFPGPPFQMAWGSRGSGQADSEFGRK